MLRSVRSFARWRASPHVSASSENCSSDRREFNEVKAVKVAIYARYSLDNQRDASIADQLRVCRAYAERQAWTICEEYTDQAVSGATLLRAGFQALMRDALNRRFDVVLAESLDRFSRDQEDTAGLFKRLTFAGVNIVTLAEGDITHLHIGFKGTMNALFLKDLAEKTHRGLRGRVEDGKSAGGLCYGYRVVKTLNAGTVTTGEREIDPKQAAIVERIFSRLRGRRVAEANREESESRGHRWSVRWRVESEHDLRQRQARHRDSEQRAVHRPAGLASPALREESRHRKARVEAQSGSRVDAQGSA
jgi:DNA invertase Pin-like site-specific DNA recombinase